MAQLSINKCRVCNEGNGSLYCHDCEHFLCQPCKTNHDKYPANKQHTVIDAVKEGRGAFKPKPVCKDHKKDYMCYCKGCDCLICIDCITTYHNGHTFIDYKIIVSDRREIVKEKIEKIKQKMKFLQDSLNTIDSIILPHIKSDRDDYEKQVDATANNLEHAINYVKHTHKTTASDYQSNETDKMMNARTNFTRIQSKYKDLLLKLENVLLEQHNVTFLFEQKATQIEMENIDEIPEIPTANHILNFNPDRFSDEVIDELQKKCSLRILTENTEQIGKLMKALEEAKVEISNLTKVKSDELSKLNATLLQEKEQYAKLKRDNERILLEKQEQVQKMKDQIEKTNLEMNNLTKAKADEVKLNATLMQEREQYTKLKTDHDRNLKETIQHASKMKEQIEKANLEISNLTKAKADEVANLNATLMQEREQFTQLKKDHGSKLREKLEQFKKIKEQFEKANLELSNLKKNKSV